jgi:acetyl-CoA synthetase
VSIYLPMAWHAAAALLACARIGAVHSVVFARFSAEALRDRVVDCACRVMMTSDQGRRAGKPIGLKGIMDTALEGVPAVKHVLVFKHTGNKVNMVGGRDHWWHEEAATVPSYCPPEILSSEDPLLLLYTSGYAGRPKGVLHVSNAFLVAAQRVTQSTCRLLADICLEPHSLSSTSLTCTL